MSTFTKAHAEDAVKKLGRSPADQQLPRLTVSEDRDAKHLKYKVWCNDQLIAYFGVKHGSKRNAGHGWIPESLGLSRRDALAFASCEMTIDELVQRFIDSGRIDSGAADD